MAIWNERIKEKRLENGYTLAQIADIMNVTEATAQRYESGSIKNIPYEIICKYAEIFHCSPAYFMGWKTILPDFIITLADNSQVFVEMKKSNPTQEQRLMQLLKYYSLLNDIGQRKALDNLEDLAKIYAEKKPIQYGSSPTRPSMVAEEPALYGSADNVENNIVTMRISDVASDKSYLIPDAAHDRTDLSEDERTDDLIRQEDDIMDDPDF